MYLIRFPYIYAFSAITFEGLFLRMMVKGRVDLIRKSVLISSNEKKEVKKKVSNTSLPDEIKS